MYNSSDPAQIVRVTFEGLDFFIKLGKNSVVDLFKIGKLLFGIIYHERLKGKTSMRNLLSKGPDLQVLQVPDKKMKEAKKLLKKCGVLYSDLKDLNKEDGLHEFAFHQEQASMVLQVIETLKSGEIKSMNDYFSGAVPEELDMALDEFSKEQGKVITPEGKKQLENLLKQAIPFVIDKKNVDEEMLAKELGVQENISAQLLTHLKTMGVVEKSESGQGYLCKSDITKEEAEARLTQFFLMFQEVKQKKDEVIPITIDQSLIAIEDKDAILTRVPGTKGKDYIWLKKSDIRYINEDKTILTHLEKEVSVPLYDKSGNSTGRNVKGLDLYNRHYDPVNRKVDKKARKQEKQVKYVTEPSKNSFQNFSQRNYSADVMADMEKTLLKKR